MVKKGKKKPKFTPLPLGDQKLVEEPAKKSKEVIRPDTSGQTLNASAKDTSSSSSQHESTSPNISQIDNDSSSNKLNTSCNKSLEMLNISITGNESEDVTSQSGEHSVAEEPSPVKNEETSISQERDSVDDSQPDNSKVPLEQNKKKGKAHDKKQAKPDKVDGPSNQTKPPKGKLDRNRWQQRSDPPRPVLSEAFVPKEDTPKSDSGTEDDWDNPNFKIPTQMNDNDGDPKNSWNERKPDHEKITKPPCKAEKRASSQERALHPLDIGLFEKHYQKNRGEIQYQIVEEKEQDLFAMPAEYSLAHCVAEDMGMGAGIAVQFRRDFQSVPELLNQRQRQGGLAVLEKNGRYIYYLVTKRDSTGKPTYQTLFNSLVNLRTHMVEKSVEKLAMPRIGCGLDRLEWKKVKYMVEYVFRGDSVEVVVCNFQQDEGSPTPTNRLRNCKVVNVPYPIQDIESSTIILYFTSEDGDVTEEMKRLDNKFHFMTEFNCARKHLGKLIMYEKNASYKLYGCVVRKKKTDPFNFVALFECVRAINQANNKLKAYYVGFEAVKDEKDDILNAKVINVLRNGLRQIDLYVCSSQSAYSQGFSSKP